MKSLVNYIIRKRVPAGKNPELPAFRGKIGIIQGWISIFINLLLFIIKLFYGLISNSIALIADAFHTLSDMASSGVVILGFKMSSKPADKEHPFGHGRAETIAALIISILIGFAGLEFIKTSISRFMSEELIEINSMLFAVISITIIVKECLARLSFSLADRINSDILKADGVHHRSDIFSSLLVMAAFGGIWMGYPKMDALMGLGVGAMMINSAFKIVRSAIDDLLGKPPTKEMIESISHIATQVNGVLNVHDIIVHQYGVKKFISLHIEVGHDRSADELHIIADMVEDKIAKKLYANVVTHIDPVKWDGSIENNIMDLVKPVIENYTVGAIQDLRIMKENGVVANISFEIPCSVEFMHKEEVEVKLKLQLSHAYPQCKIEIKFINQIN